MPHSAIQHDDSIWCTFHIPCEVLTLVHAATMASVDGSDYRSTSVPYFRTGTKESLGSLGATGSSY